MRFLLSFALVVACLGGLTPSARLFAQPKDPKLPDLPPNLLAPTDPLSPADERKQFTLPPGFDAQLVASEPDIQKPMQMAFDAKGRLWVTTSYHYPFAAEKGKATDKLFVLSDFDPETGKAKKVQVFASDLNIPIGILPLPDCKSCIVSSLGEIRKYTDTDGDGKADKSEVLFTGFGFEDTHGMYNSFTLMPDGWVYACHGFKNESSVKGKDGHEVKMQSGHTFRFRPDGSRIEVWTRGQVNPFGMAVDPWFNLYTADCHSKPITQLIPGAYHESFGKPHDGLGFAPHVTAHSHNSTGLCGVAWYDADHFPKEFLGTMFVGNVVTNRINFDRIEWKGATPVAKELPDFLVSKDRWFRPVDIKLGPDGALYVADFYNKIIGHYEVNLKDPRRDKDRGRIWRIVWKGNDGKAPAPKFHRADFTAAKDDELFDDLFHPNLTVRFLAGHQLRHRMAEGQNVLTNSDAAFAKALKSPESESAFVAWLVFIGEADKNVVKRYADFFSYLRDPKRSERLTGHMIRAFTSRLKWGDDERKLLAELFKSSASAHQTRAAVEAVIAHPHADFIKPLVELIGKCPADDTHLRHAAKVALRNCLRDINSWPEGDDAIYVEMAIAIPDRKAASYLVFRLKTKSIPADKLAATAEHIARYGGVADVDLLVGWVRQQRNVDIMLGAFRGVQARGKKLNEEQTKLLLSDGLHSLASESFLGNDPRSEDVKAVFWGIRLLNALPAVGDPDVLKIGSRVGIDKQLEGFIAREKAPDNIRVGAAEAALTYWPVEGLKAIQKQLAEPGTPEGIRQRFLVAMASSLSSDARLDARDALKTVPYRSAVPIGLALAGTPGGAEILLDAVKAGIAPARLLQERAILERLKASNAPGWEKRVADLTKNLPAADQRIADLLKTRAAGFAKVKPDKELGAKLFTKHCAACHKIGDAGGKIAPQLDGVGVRGTERLLEDILDPNRNVDAAFRARSILLTNEKTLTALMLRVEGEVLVVADFEGKEQRLPLKEIATNRETMLSAMPANFGDTVPEADLYHLLAYLLDQKAKEPLKQ